VHWAPKTCAAARCGGCAARSGRAALRRRPAASPSPQKRLETPEAAGQNRPPQQHRPCPRNLFEHRQAAQRDALDCPTAGFECLNVSRPYATYDSEGGVVIMRTFKKIRSNFRTEEKISRFSWRGASCGSIVVSSVLRSQLLADLRAATGRTQIPPVIGLIGVFGAIRVFLLFLGGGHKSGRGSREPALPSGVAARGCPRALMHVPWCRRRAMGRPRWP
jgi:hypothetical protein